MTDRNPRPTYSPGNGYVTKRRVFTTLGILAAFLIGMGVNSGSENTQNWADAPVSPSTTVTNRQLQELANPPGLTTRDALPTSQIYYPPPAPTGPVTSFSPGTYAIGTDVVPGTYKSRGGSGYGSCYWARLHDTSGTLDSIIANNVSQGQAVVTISPSDGAFKTSGCNAWQKVG